MAEYVVKKPKLLEITIQMAQYEEVNVEDGKTTNVLNQKVTYLFIIQIISDC